MNVNFSHMRSCQMVVVWGTVFSPSDQIHNFYQVHSFISTVSQVTVVHIIFFLQSNIPYDHMTLCVWCKIGVQIFQISQCHIDVLNIIERLHDLRFYNSTIYHYFCSHCVHNSKLIYSKRKILLHHVVWQYDCTTLCVWRKIDFQIISDHKMSYSPSIRSSMAQKL